MTQPVHATVAACWVPGEGWRGVMLSGPPGVGKSDLALRLIARGWRLVSDDYAHVFASGGAAWAVAPDTIIGRMEVRGVGIRPARTAQVARIVLAVELTPGVSERLPEDESVVVAGAPVPRLRLDPREASAVEKVAVAIGRL